MKRTNIVILLLLVILVFIGYSIIFNTYNDNQPSGSCPEGQWSESGNKPGCKVCNTTCKDPKIINQPCTKTSDITCKDPPPTTCDDGQWSPSGDFTDCQSCTVCVSTQIVDVNCTSTSDTVCKDETDQYYVDCNLAIGKDKFEGTPTISISLDGGNVWNETSISDSRDDRIKHVKWWDEKKIWVGSGKLGNSPIFTSINGTDWIPISLEVPLNDYIIGPIACTSDTCVMLYGDIENKVIYSHDGETWEIADVDISLYQFKSIDTDGSNWVASAEVFHSDIENVTTLMWSDDGINWVSLGNDIFPEGGVVVKTNGTMWIAAGIGTVIAHDYNGFSFIGKIAHSTDGKTWNVVGPSPLGTDAVGTSIDWSGNQWLLMLADGLYSSVDGSTWRRLINFGETDPDLGYIPLEVRWSGSQWLIVGNTNLLGYGGDSYLSSSADGVTWVNALLEDTYYYDIVKGKIPASQP